MIIKIKTLILVNIIKEIKAFDIFFIFLIQKIKNLFVNIQKKIAKANKKNILLLFIEFTLILINKLIKNIKNIKKPSRLLFQKYSINKKTFT